MGVMGDWGNMKTVTKIKLQNYTGNKFNIYFTQLRISNYNLNIAN